MRAPTAFHLDGANERDWESSDLVVMDRQSYLAYLILDGHD